jgi:hypothetical protein
MDAATRALSTNVICTPLVEDLAATAAAGGTGLPLPLTRVSVKNATSGILGTRRNGGAIVRVSDESNWPATTSKLCWHCCHAFDGPPLPMPTRYDDRLDVFHVCGTFCSWSCMKAYNLDASSYLSKVNSNIISLFYKRCTHDNTLGAGIRPAPPRLALQAFGGDMSIDDFRQCATIKMIPPPKMIVHQPVVQDIPQHLRNKPTALQLQDTVSFKDTVTQNDMLRLRRPKPLTAHNMLVRTLGVQILSNA